MDPLTIEAAIEAAIKLATFIGNAVGNQQAVSDLIAGRLASGSDKWTAEDKKKIKDLVAAQKEYARKQLETDDDPASTTTPKP